MNPWTDEYLARELATMQELISFDQDGVRLRYSQVDGEMDCYLRRDYLAWGPFPKLTVGETIWMSMTPQEIESQYMPIRLAEGQVGLGGLGLGYAAARIASKPSVSHVLVYETNPVVIELWYRNFGEHPKIKIVQQDVATIRGLAFDLFFNDVYAKMWDDETWEHWNLLTDWNDIGWYHPWGIEAYLLALVLDNRRDEIPYSWRRSYFPFLQQLLEATDPARGSRNMHGVLEVERHFPSIEAVDQDLRSLRPDLWSEA